MHLPLTTPRYLLRRRRLRRCVHLIRESHRRRLALVPDAPPGAQSPRQVRPKRAITLDPPNAHEVRVIHPSHPTRHAERSPSIRKRPQLAQPRPAPPVSDRVPVLEQPLPAPAIQRPKIRHCVPSHILVSRSANRAFGADRHEGPRRHSRSMARRASPLPTLVSFIFICICIFGHARDRFGCISY